MYRPPNNKVNEFDGLLENFLMKINRENKKCYLLGDFNIDAIKLGNNTVADKFNNQLLSSSFYPLITKPTRITERSATLIDIIYHMGSVSFVLSGDQICYSPLIIYYLKSWWRAGLKQ